jgi:DNA replication protein DnaC
MHRITTVRIGNDEIPFGPFVCDCEAFQNEHEAARECQRQEELARQHQERVERIERLFRNSTLPERWRDRTFQAFHKTEGTQAAYDTAYRYMREFNRQSGAGLLFTGGVGLGKTHLAAAIAMELMSRELSVVYGTVSSLLAQIRNTYDDGKETEMIVRNRYAKSDLLVIDEIGKEKVNAWVGQTVYDIINARYENNKAMVITTNLSLAEIRKKYNDIDSVRVGIGDAIVDRIYEVCQGVQFTGTSWRKQSLGERS